MDFRESATPVVRDSDDEDLMDHPAPSRDWDLEPLEVLELGESRRAAGLQHQLEDSVSSGAFAGTGTGTKTYTAPSLKYTGDGQGPANV